MPLFASGKPTTTVSQYARWFHTFGPSDRGSDPEVARTAYVKAIIDLVAKQDERFAQTDLVRFDAEFVALRAEIFGIAWGHAFNAKDKHLLGEGKVAKEALTEMGLWDCAEKYNQAAARSSDAALPKGERARAGVVTFQNSWRVSMVKNWGKQGVDRDVIVRVVNRIFTQESWKSGETLRYMSGELIQALGFVDRAKGEVNLNQGALLTLQVPLLDIYKGSREGISQNNIKAE